MQALTRTLYPCYASPDREIAERIATFLERGADVRVFLEEGEMEPGGDLAAKARDGRMADLVLVLFSRNSMPPRWPRAQWEDALVNEPAEEGVGIAFVRVDDCVPPRVLTPMFEASRLREIKRWVRRAPPGEAPSSGHSGDVEVLGIAIADRPGSETVADIAVVDAFIRAFSPDFDAVVRLETGERRLAAIAGDLGEQLGLRLEGGLPENLERLQAFCESRRLLIVHEGGEVPELTFGAQCSTLICLGGGRPSTDILAPIHAAFAADTDWTSLCQAARQARRLARDMGRIAELYDIMEAWAAMAAHREDREAQNEALREVVWILDGWGRTQEARRVDLERAGEFDVQMPLPLLFDF